MFIVLVILYRVFWNSVGRGSATRLFALLKIYITQGIDDGLQEAVS